MRLSNLLRGRRVRKSEWHVKDWIRIDYVGREFVEARTPDGGQIVFPYMRYDLDWVLVNPQIPLTPLRQDWVLDLDLDLDKPE